jgi:fucose permease
MPRRSTALVVLSFLGFASLGLPDGVLGVAWPSMRAGFGLPLDALGALLIATTAGYVTSSFLAGALLARISVGALLALSCLATGATLLGYAAAPIWAAMVTLGVIAGLGAGAIDAGINTFAATNFAPRTLHLLHAAYGVGTTAGPIWMTSVLMGGFAWQRGYLAIGAVQLVLAAGFAATLRLWPGPPRGEASRAPPAAPLAETLRLPKAQLGAAAFFLYLGVEATAGAWLFSLLEEGRGASMAAAGAATSLYWGGLLVGRIGFGFAPNSLRPETLLPPAIAGAAACAALLALDLGTASSLVAAAGLGLCVAPIFPALIGATPERLGPAHTANTVGVQVAAAALGQSSLPALAGLLAEHGGLEWVPRMIIGLALALFAVNALLARLPACDPIPLGIRRAGS